MGQNVNPATPTAPNASPLAISATDATTVALKTLAEHIGAAAANARLQQGGLPQGYINGGGAQVQTPTPALMPQPGNPGDIPMIGGGFPDAERAGKADATNLMNTVKHGLDAYTAKKNQENVIKASRDYESLMKAYQINQSLQEQLKADPNNATLKAMVDQNNSVINGFFDDDKKRKRLEKVMGIEVDAKAAVTGGAEAAKAKVNDPEYVAFKKAQENVKNGTSSMPGPDGGSLPNVGGSPIPTTFDQTGGKAVNSAMGQESLGMPSNMPPPWLQGLNPRAAAFFGKQPVAPGSMSYVPSPQELGEAWRVAAKISPDGNSRNDLLKTITEWNSRGLTEVFKSLNERDIEEAKLQYKKYGDDLDAGTKWNIALANVGIEKGKLALDTWYKQNDILLRNKDLNIKSADTFGKVYDQGVSIAEQNVRLAEQGYLAAQEAAKTAKTMGTAGASKQGNSDLIAAGYQKLLEAHSKLDQVTKEREDFNARARGITTNPSGAGTGKSVIDGLKGGSSATPTPQSNSGATATPAAVPAGQSPAGGDSNMERGADWFKSNVLPFFGGKAGGPI